MRVCGAGVGYQLFRREWSVSSAQDPCEQHNYHRAYCSRYDAAHQRVAKTKLDAEPVEEGTSDERSDETCNNILQKARPAHNPACQPACHGTDADLDRNSALVESSERLMVDADADRGAEARLNSWLGLAPRPVGELLRSIRHARDMGIIDQERSGTITHWSGRTGEPAGSDTEVDPPSWSPSGFPTRCFPACDALAAKCEYLRPS